MFGNNAGMGMMLKSLGIDPEAMTAQVSQFGDAINKRISIVENKIDYAIALLEKINAKSNTEFLPAGDGATADNFAAHTD